MPLRVSHQKPYVFSLILLLLYSKWNPKSSSISPLLIICSTLSSNRLSKTESQSRNLQFMKTSRERIPSLWQSSHKMMASVNLSGPPNSEPPSVVFCSSMISLWVLLFCWYTCKLRIIFRLLFRWIICAEMGSTSSKILCNLRLELFRKLSDSIGFENILSLVSSESVNSVSVNSSISRSNTRCLSSTLFGSLIRIFHRMDSM